MSTGDVQALVYEGLALRYGVDPDDLRDAEESGRFSTFEAAVEHINSVEAETDGFDDLEDEEDELEDLPI